MGWTSDAALASTDAACADHFDTASFTAIAMTKPALAVNAETEPDASRPAFDFRGTLDIAPEFSAMASSARPSPADRNMRKVERVCLTALSAGWPWMPRQGDQIRAADALYVVAASPDRDGTARIALWLNKISA